MRPSAYNTATFIHRQILSRQFSPVGKYSRFQGGHCFGGRLRGPRSPDGETIIYQNKNITTIACH